MKHLKPLSVMLAILMLFTCFAGLSFAVEATSIGHVTVSFEDFGDREFLYDTYDDDICHPDPYGVIFEASEVEIFEGDTLADAVIRWLEENEVEYTSQNSFGFALYTISFTDSEGNYVEDFGGGSITPDDDFLTPFSGWMVRVNNNYGSGLSYYTAQDGDIVRFTYTCEMGADIGGDFYHPSAAIIGLEKIEDYGTLSPAFSEDVKEYTLSVASDVDAVKVSAVLENYNAVTTYKVGNTEYKYLRDIPVENGTVITVSTLAERHDNLTWDVIETFTDSVTVTVEKEGSSEEPAAPEEEAPLSFFGRVRAFFVRIFDNIRNFFRRIADFFRR